MYKGKTILALIPARGGSKVLPGKNIRLLAGRPLIAWTIKQAKASRYIDRIVVSTDDGKIAAVAKKYGAEVPFLRPLKYATDKALAIDVIMHALDWMENYGFKYDLLMLLQPTSPLRTVRDIDNSIDFLARKNARAIVSVCKTEHHPYWSNVLTPGLGMKNFVRPEMKNKNRQDLPIYYRINGAIYLAYRRYLRKQKSFLGKKTMAYIMDRESSVDIDDILDLEFAELRIKKKKYK